MQCDVIEKLRLSAIVPVVTIENAEDAVPLAKAILAGGLNSAEITLRTAAGIDAISAISQAFPDMLVGAGTVLSVEDAERAVQAGARFIVSPCLDVQVVSWCVEREIPCVPGISTATEVHEAMKLGVSTLKLFPAQLLGGAAYIKSLSSVYPGVRFMTTGGINLENLCSFLDVPSIFCVGGTWLCPKNLIAEHRFDQIEKNVQEAVSRMFQFKLLHIGLNSRNEQEARKNGSDFAAMFSLPLEELPGAYFAGTMMEIVKKPFLGEHGHIAISTKYMDRAMDYFERRGYRFRPTEGNREELVAAYFTHEIGGFAIHLRRALEA